MSQKKEEIKFDAPFDGSIEKIVTLINFYREEEARAMQQEQGRLRLAEKTTIFPTNVEKDLIFSAGRDDKLMAEYWKTVLRNISKVELAKVGVTIEADTLKFIETKTKAEESEILKQRAEERKAENKKIEEDAAKRKADPAFKDQPAKTEESAAEDKKVETTAKTDEPAKQDVKMDVVHKKEDSTGAPDDIEITETLKSELYDLYLQKGGGKALEGEITDEDRKNPFVIVETRDEGKTETKREASFKEQAVIKYRTYMTAMGRNMEDVSNSATRYEVADVVSAYKPTRQKEDKEALLEKYKGMKLDTARKSIDKTMKADDLKKLKAFNINILAGSSDAKGVKAEDLLKLKAISLAASGKFREAVTAVEAFYKDVEGIGKDTAAIFVSNLMGKDPYIEMDNVLTTLLTDDKDKHLQHEKLMFMIVKGYTGWDDKKITKHINVYIDGLKQTTQLAVSAQLIGVTHDPKESKVNENVNDNAKVAKGENKKVEEAHKENLKSKGKKPTEKKKTAVTEKKTDKKDTKTTAKQESKKTEKKVETTKAKEAEKTPSKTDVAKTDTKKDVKSDDGKGKGNEKPATGDKVSGKQAPTAGPKTPEATTEEKPAENKDGLPTLRVTFRANAKKTTYRGSLINDKGIKFDYVARVSPKQSVEESIQAKFDNHIASARKNPKLGIPAGFENYKKGDKINIELVEPNAAAS